MCKKVILVHTGIFGDAMKEILRLLAADAKRPAVSTCGGSNKYCLAHRLSILRVRIWCRLAPVTCSHYIGAPITEWVRIIVDFASSETSAGAVILL